MPTISSHSSLLMRTFVKAEIVDASSFLNTIDCCERCFDCLLPEECQGKMNHIAQPIRPDKSLDDCHTGNTGTENSRRKDLIEHIDSTSRGNHWFELMSCKVDHPILRTFSGLSWLSHVPIAALYILAGKGVRCAA
jgi:hypothetical protein